MIKVLGYEIPNTMQELTVKQFEKISEVLNDESRMKIERFVDVFAFLGVPIEELDEMGIPEFMEVFKEFNNVDNKQFESVEEFELNGYTYKANWIGEEDEPTLSVTVKEFKLIESYVKEKKDYMSYIMAVLFKRTDLSKTEHYANAHIKQKQKLFKELPAYYCIRYISEVMQKLTND